LFSFKLDSYRFYLDNAVASLQSRIKAHLWLPTNLGQSEHCDFIKLMHCNLTTVKDLVALACAFRITTLTHTKGSLMCLVFV